MTGIFLQFLTQPPDVDVESAGIAQIFGFPNLFHNRATIQNLIRVLHEEAKQIEFLGGKMLNSLTTLHLALQSIDRDATNSQKPVVLAANGFIDALRELPRTIGNKQKNIVRSMFK